MNEVLDLKCPTCGNKIVYDPFKSKWICNSCGNIYNLDDIKQEDKEIISDVVLDNYNCKNCGAEIIADSNLAATSCIYCGNTAIIKSRLSDEYKPDFILPFKTNKEEIREAVNTMADSYWLLDHDYLKECNIEGIKGIYIPYFLYTFTLTASITITVETKKNRFHYHKNVKLAFDKIPIDGSLKLDDELMMNVFPYKTNGAFNYRHEYLSGFSAERYDDNKVLLKERINNKAKSSIEYFVRKEFSSSVSSIDYERIDISEPIVKQVLLPVWLINVKHRNSSENLYVMNGQTKEVVGNVPYNSFRVSLFFMFISFIFLSICFLLLNLEINDNSLTFCFFAGISLYGFYFYEYKRNQIVKECKDLSIFEDKIKFEWLK